MYCDLRTQPCTLWEQINAIMIDAVTKNPLGIEETVLKALSSSQKTYQSYHDVEALDILKLNFVLN